MPEMAEHRYIEVGARRWCVGCNTYQVRRNGMWRDSEEMIGPWPGYARTMPHCTSV